MSSTRKRKIAGAFSLVLGIVTLAIMLVITGGRIAELRPTILLTPAIMIIGGFIVMILPSMPHEKRYDKREDLEKRVTYIENELKKRP